MHQVYRWEFVVSPEAIDANRHVNNVLYVQWMQEIAMAHAAATGGTAAADALGGVWFARSHKIEYLRAAVQGDALIVLTWIVDMGRVRSRRGYQFLRAADGVELACAESEWVFVDAASSRPRAIPPEVAACFVALGEDISSVDLSGVEPGLRSTS
jgi:acyl-CoA thioester hydrolase